MINTEFKEQILQDRTVHNNYHYIWNYLDVNFESSIWQKFYSHVREGAWVSFHLVLRGVREDYDTHKVKKGR